MKKGCFVKTIIFLTIITAVLLYMINYKFDNIILNPSKQIIINRISQELSIVKESPEKDSLKLLIRNYIMRVKKVKSFSGREIGHFVDSLKIALADSVIDRHEYKNLYMILNRKVN